MTQEQALNILVQGVNIGQSKGAYSLQEASILSQAISVFQSKKEEPVEAKTEQVEQVKQ